MVRGGHIHLTILGAMQVSGDAVADVAFAVVFTTSKFVQCFGK